jgi:hypothetical protein
MLVDTELLSLLKSIEGQIGVSVHGTAWVTLLKKSFTIGKTIAQATLEIVNHLFDLENTTEDASLNINLNTEEFNNEDDTEHDDFVAFLLDGMKKELKPPTLDQLLDKIKSDGIGTLTQFERGILDNYSNN